MIVALFAATLLLHGGLARQDDGRLTSSDWLELADQRTMALFEAPADEREPLVTELEELFFELQDRVLSQVDPDSLLNMALWHICMGLSDVDRELLFEQIRETYIQNAMAASMGTGNAEMIAGAYCAQSRALRDLGRSSEGIELLLEARGHISRIAIPLDRIERLEARASHALGRARLAALESDLYRLLGKFDDARAAIDEADRLHVIATSKGQEGGKLRKSRGGSVDKGWLALNQQGVDALRAQFQGRRFELSLDLGLRELAFEALCAEEEAANSAYELATASLHRGHLTLYTNRFADAEQHFLDATRKPWFKSLPHSGREIFFWLRAKSRDKLEWVEPDRSKESRRLLTEVIESGELRSNELLYALCTLARNDLRAGKLEQARASLDAAIDLLQNAEHGRDSLDYRMQVHWMSALEAELAMARNAPLEEQETAHRRIRDETDSFLETWAQVPVRTGGIGFLHHGRRSSSLSALIDITLSVTDEEHGAEEALAPLLAALSHGALARSFVETGHAPVVPSLETIRDLLLPEGGGMLIYLVSEERSHIFALDHDDVDVAIGPPEHEIEALRSEFVSFLLRPPPVTERERGRIEDAFIHASHALGSVLIPEALRPRVESWTGITLCGLSTVGHVPFEALLVGDKFLGDEFPITYLASPSLGKSLFDREKGRLPRDPGGLDLLLFAAPHIGGGESAARLHWEAEYELELAGAHGRVACFSGSEATYERLAAELSASLPTVLQVIAHTIGENEVEMNRVMLLSPTDDHDEFVRHEDFRALQAPSLTILTSCAAGDGQARRGDDGIDHLGGASMLAGSGTVALSTHDVHFHAAMELMRVFHEHLASGESTARSMYEARRSLIDHEKYSHPYFRSLVHVTGLGHLPVFD